MTDPQHRITDLPLFTHDPARTDQPTPPPPRPAQQYTQPPAGLQGLAGPTTRREARLQQQPSTGWSTPNGHHADATPAQAHNTHHAPAANPPPAHPTQAQAFPPPQVPAFRIRTDPVAPTAPSYDPTPVDWALVRTFRQLASQRLAEQLAARPGIDDDDRRELGRDIIRTLLTEHARADAQQGRPLLDPATEAALASAIFDSLFGLGRLEPLVNLHVENIEITGCDNVLLIYPDGRKEFAPPVADSDEELVEFLAFLAARRGGAGERAFSTANPVLHLNLGGRARLLAIMEVSHRPIVRIRKHLLTEVTMPMLREIGTIDLVLEQFLAAAIRARKSVVVSGSQGSGKTTFIRALAGAIDPWEALATLETEYELFIHELPSRKRPAIPLEARPGSGELRPDGTRAGAITLEQLFEEVLRANLDRIIVGEVRGPEAMAMFKAMQSGAGSLCTTHATSARDAIERLVTCVVSANGNEAYASRLVAQHVDIIVHLSALPDPRTGRRRRFVAEVIEVTPGEGYRPAVNDLFRPGPDGRAVPHTRPSFLDELVAAGFDASLLDDHNGAWGPIDTRVIDITQVGVRR